MPTTIHDLPNELLSDIFTLCTSSCADAPAIISAVSRDFRIVVLGTPRTWSKLRLSLRRASREGCFVRKAGLWFSRAGNCPIALFIELSALEEIARDDRTMNQTLPFLTAFLRHRRSSIGTLNVQSDTEIKAFAFLEAIYETRFSSSSAESPQLLQNLRIRITSDIPNAPPTTWSPVFSSFDRFPGLQSLKLTNHVLPALPTPSLANLQTLTILRPLRAHPLPISKLVVLLNSAPQLERLEVDSRIRLEPGLLVVPSVELTGLKKLMLRTNSLHIITSLVSPGRLLEVIRLVDLDGRRPHAAVELGLHLQAKQAEVYGDVQSLEISGVSFQPSEKAEEVWGNVLRMMKNLRNLAILDPAGLGGDGGGCVIRGLRRNSELACPLLQQVCLSGINALLSLQRLKIERPGVMVEWDTGGLDPNSSPAIRQLDLCSSVGFGNPPLRKIKLACNPLISDDEADEAW